jgi:hypothetical protein
VVFPVIVLLAPHTTKKSQLGPTQPATSNHPSRDGTPGQIEGDAAPAPYAAPTQALFNKYFFGLRSYPFFLLLPHFPHFLRPRNRNPSGPKNSETPSRSAPLSRAQPES